MRSFIYCIVLLVFFTSFLFGQVVDSFSDGDFTSSPIWSGDTGSWQIVTNSTSAAGASGSNSLRLNHTVSESGTQYLSTQRTQSWGTEQSSPCMGGVG